MRKRDILIVDDVPDNIDLLVDLLSDKYELQVALDGVKALDLIDETRPPDLILLDVMMPRMDGYEVCRRLKANPATREIPVIFLTAKASPEDILKGFQLGAVDYVAKPFNPPEALARINTHLLITEQQRTITSQNAELKALLHVLCHDLSNHFTVVEMALDYKRICPDEPLDTFRDNIAAAVGNGRDVINLIREIRKMEDKSIQLDSVDLLEVVNESLLLLKHQFDEKRIQAIVEIEPETTVVAERRSLINSVVNNLLTNAVKFSEADSKIVISAHSAGDQVHVEFKDFGVGMPERLMNALFDVGASTSRPGTAGEKGTGFGMPLVKKFMEAYGGTIEVESKERTDDDDEAGTTMRLIFKTPSEEEER